MKIAKLNIDGYIGSADIASMFSGEKTFSFSDAKDFLENLPNDVTDIHVYINSGGGSVIDGWAIHDKLKTSKYNITTIGEGIVGSIATVIFMAGTQRKVHENTNFYIHNPYWQPDAPEPMEAKDLYKLGDELMVEENKILNYYVKATGSELGSIEPLMKGSTSLTSVQAKELGFANEIITEHIAARAYKIAACIKNNSKQKDNMEKSISDKIAAAFTKFENKMRRVFFKNMQVTATDKSGTNVELFIDSETEDWTGKKVYLVDADGNQTDAPDDTYVLADGRSISVADGVVTEIKDAVIDEAETVETLKAKLAAAELENSTLKANVQASTTENTELKASITEIQKDFEATKKIVIGAGVKFNKGTQIVPKEKDTEKKGSEFANDYATRLKNRYGNN